MIMNKRQCPGWMREGLTFNSLLEKNEILELAWQFGTPLGASSKSLSSKALGNSVRGRIKRANSPHIPTVSQFYEFGYRPDPGSGCNDSIK